MVNNLLKVLSLLVCVGTTTAFVQIQRRDHHHTFLHVSSNIGVNENGIVTPPSYKVAGHRFKNPIMTTQERRVEKRAIEEAREKLEASATTEVVSSATQLDPVISSSEVLAMEKAEIERRDAELASLRALCEEVKCQYTAAVIDLEKLKEENDREIRELKMIKTKMSNDFHDLMVSKVTEIEKKQIVIKELLEEKESFRACAKNGWEICKKRAKARGKEFLETVIRIEQKVFGL